jgi:hypothetical protein
VTSAQLAFHRDMIMPMSYMAHRHSIHQWSQAISNHDNLCENVPWVPHSHIFSGQLSPYPSRHSWQTCQTHLWTLPIDWCGTPTCQWYCHGWFESLSRNVQHLVIDSV